MTNIGSNPTTSHIDSTTSTANNNNNDTLLGNTSPLTELNTSPQKEDPFEHFGSVKRSRRASIIPSGQLEFHSDSSSELSDITSEAETDKMELPEGSDLKAMAEFMAENNKDLADSEVKEEVVEEVIKHEDEDTSAKDIETKDEETKDVEEEVVEDEEHEEEDEDEEPEISLKIEEDEAEEEKKALEAEKQPMRQQAIEELTTIEIDYAKLKDLLYQSRLLKLEYELKLCLEGSHPDFIRILNKVNENYDRKIQTLIMSQNYKLNCINNQTKLTRYQIHQQYLKNCQDLKLKSIEDTTTKWYKINKERRMMDQQILLGNALGTSPILNLNSHKRKIRDSDNKSILFNEIGKLNKIQKIYGFPSGIANLSGAEDFEIEEDLINIRRRPMV